MNNQITIQSENYLKDLALKFNIVIPDNCKYQNNFDYLTKKIFGKRLEPDIHLNVIHAWLDTCPSILELTRRVSCMNGQQMKHGSIYKNNKSLELLKKYCRQEFNDGNKIFL